MENLLICPKNRLRFYLYLTTYYKEKSAFHISFFISSTSIVNVLLTFFLHFLFLNKSDVIELCGIEEDRIRKYLHFNFLA